MLNDSYNIIGKDSSVELLPFAWSEVETFTIRRMSVYTLRAIGILINNLADALEETKSDDELDERLENNFDSWTDLENTDKEGPVEKNDILCYRRDRSDNVDSGFRGSSIDNMVVLFILL